MMILISISCLSCGSGTFENDPKTWHKVFGGEVPNEVEILNSRFWKSAHFTYEYELFMEFKSSQSFADSFFIKKFRFKPTKAPKFDLNYDEEKPKWFVPKSFEAYDVWQSDINNMNLLIDKSSNLMFLYALQL